MSATITWVIEWMQAYPQFEGQTDVVISAGWRCIGSQENNNNTYTAFAYGSSSFTLDPEQTFTPYADLTQEQVLGWVWADGVDKDAIEASIQQQINEQINPPVVTPPLPWATTQAGE